jgi:hypothetical protein
VISLTLAFLDKTEKKLIREVVAFTSNYFSCNLSWPDHIRNTTSQHQDNNFSKRKKRFNYLIRVKGWPEVKNHKKQQVRSVPSRGSLSLAAPKLK